MAIKVADFIKVDNENSAIVANTCNKIVALKIELIPVSYYDYLRWFPDYFGKIYKTNLFTFQLNFRDSALPRLSGTPPSTLMTNFEGSDDEIQTGSGTETPGLMSRKEVRRRSKKPVPDEKKDDQYWKRRHKNNMAAKRSREARRYKESELSKRATVLEMEHNQLR